MLEKNIEQPRLTKNNQLYYDRLNISRRHHRW